MVKMLRKSSDSSLALIIIIAKKLG